MKILCLFQYLCVPYFNEFMKVINWNEFIIRGMKKYNLKHYIDLSKLDFYAESLF